MRKFSNISKFVLCFLMFFICTPKSFSGAIVEGNLKRGYSNFLGKNNKKMEMFIEGHKEIDITVIKEDGQIIKYIFNMLRLDPTWEWCSDLTSVPKEYITPIMRQRNQLADHYLSISNLTQSQYSVGACHNGRWEEGSVITKYPNGNLKCSVDYMKGVKNGDTKCYDQDGNLMLYVIYKNGEAISGYCNNKYLNTKTYLNEIQLSNFSNNGYIPCDRTENYNLELMSNIFDYNKYICSFSIKKIAEYISFGKNIDFDEFKLLNNDYSGWEKYQME